MSAGNVAVTVGLPVYNDPEGLRRSLPSVLNQTWDGPVRLLIVDDGSTDETPRVLDELSSVYGRIDVVRHPENRGRPQARNTILEHAGDGYLTWLDAGDLWHPRKLELQLATLLPAEERDPQTPLMCTCPMRWYFHDREEERVKAPEVAGDQLRNALTGSLLPYLATMLGRADHFRAVGFDERLLRRQDYDLLVRFVGSGGRFVSTAAAQTPLYTYLKSDVGSSPRKVAAANRVIRREHRTYYRRYDRRLAWQVRHNQHRLVARFHRHNGHLLRAAAYRTWAAVVDPDLVAKSLARAKRLAAPLRPAVRGISRLLTRLLMPVMPLLRRTGVTTLARRLGLVRLLAALGIMRVFYGEVHTHAGSRTSEASPPDHPPSTTDDRREAPSAAAPEERLAPDAPPVDTEAVRQATAALERDEYATAIEVLEAAVSSGDPIDPHGWILLEQAYRRHGSLAQADDALRRALERHPDTAELELRLIELLSLRREWTECVERWLWLDVDADAMRPLTHARVARAFQALGDPGSAFTVARSGAERWPDERRVRDELRRSRAALVDWRRAAVPARSPAPGPSSPEAVGVVTELGFLVGGDGPIAGRVRPSGPASPSVSLIVNDVPVAATSGAPDGEDGRWFTFSLSCHDLLTYLGDGDIVRLASDGDPIELPDGARRLVAVTGYDSAFGELAARLDAGYVFTKFGRLRPGNTPERKEAILTLYREVAELIAEHHGHTTFPFYGNLLGAIREHDLIAHDVGGFDMGYVSRHSTPGEVREEFLAVCATLRDAGYHLTLEPWSTYVRHGPRDGIFVDVNYAWFTPAGELHLSYGWRYPPVTDRERLHYPRECPIGRHLVRVPGNAEDVLEQIYGPSWPVPDQGFELEVDLKRDVDFLLTVDEMTALAASDPDRFRAKVGAHPDGPGADPSVEGDDGFDDGAVDEHA